MCDDLCDAPSAWRERWRRARTQHRCCACRETIRVGDRYHYASGIWDGHADSFKHCIRCWAIFRALVAESDDPVDLRLDCGELWSANFGVASEPVELAFMTADEAQALAVSP